MYLELKFTEDIRRVESDECVTNDFGHLINVTCVGPVRVVDGGKGQVLRLIGKD